MKMEFMYKRPKRLYSPVDLYTTGKVKGGPSGIRKMVSVAVQKLTMGENQKCFDCELKPDVFLSSISLGDNYCKSHT